MQFELKVPRPPNPRQLVRALAGMGMHLSVTVGDGTTRLDVNATKMDKRHYARASKVVDDNLTLIVNYFVSRKFCCVRTCHEVAAWVGDVSAIENRHTPMPELVVYSWYYCERHKPDPRRQNRIHLERL